VFVCVCVYMCVSMDCGMNVGLSAKLANLSLIKELKYTCTCSGNTVYEEVTVHIYFINTKYGNAGC
jgi:hypothetical protein